VGKRLVITGATGLIGKELTKKFLKAGYSVTVITRNSNKARHIFADTVDIIEWYLNDKNKSVENICPKINGAFAVINLAGENIGSFRWNKRKKNLILHSRLKSVDILYNALKNCPQKPSLYLGASAIGYYGNTGDVLVNELNNAGGDFLALTVKKWEESQLKFSLFVERIILARMGMVLSNNGGAFPKLVLPYRLFLGGKLGSGNQWLSWIHIEDLTQVFLKLLETPGLQGAINIVSSNPLQMKGVNEILGKTLGRPYFFHVPSFFLKALMGEAASMVLNSSKVEPMILKSLNFKFTFEDFQSAINNLLNSNNPKFK